MQSLAFPGAVRRKTKFTEMCGNLTGSLEWPLLLVSGKGMAGDRAKVFFRRVRSLEKVDASVLSISIAGEF